MLSGRLPERVQSGAVKRLLYSTEVVENDGGLEVRNARWAEPKAAWDCTIPPCKRTSADYLDTKAMFDAALGSFETFEFHDPVDCEDYLVRFLDDTLSVTTVGNLVSVTFTLVQVKTGDSP